MWSFWPGIVAFAVALASGWVAEWIDRTPRIFALILAVIGMILSAYSVANGAVHAVKSWGYIDLLGPALSQGLIKSPKEGLALVLASFWPFICFLAGLAGCILYYRILRKRL